MPDHLDLPVTPATRFWARLRGLIGRRAPRPGEALWLSPCKQVHGFFMGYGLDVVGVDRQGRVLGVARLAPWGLGPYWGDAWGVLELAEGEAGRLGISPGGRLRLLDLTAGGRQILADAPLAETRGPLDT